MRGLAGGTSGLLLAGILVYALNLRAPIAALPPVVADVATDLSLTQASAGLLTGIPVLCFALLTPVASGALARWGAGTAVAVSLVTVLTGTLLRSSGSFATAVGGTVLIGAAITIGNVAVPVIVNRDFQSYASTVTGLYTAALNAGSVLTTTFTAPLAQDIGWQWALASWSILAVAALVVWRFAAPHLRPDDGPSPRARGRRPGGALGTEGADAAGGASGTADAAGGASGTGNLEGPSPLAPDDRRDRAASSASVLRRPLTWLLAAAFAGQSFGYYSMTAWLPSLLGDEIGIPATSAGGAASLFQFLAIVGGIGVPTALARGVPIRRVAMALASCWLTLPVGLLVAPELWPLWCGVAGVAQGGNFAVIFTLVAVRAGSSRDTRRMSAAVQTTGYACAAAGPTLLGAVHTATGSWDAPLAVVLGMLVVMTVALVTASSARPRPVPGAR